MKKIMFIAAAAIMMATATVKAETPNNEVNYNLTMNSASLTRCLHMDSNQAEIMEYATEELSRSIARLKNMSEEKRVARLNAALRRNLSIAHKTLNDEQYHLYLSVLNCTFNNKGLNHILFSEELAMK